MAEKLEEVWLGVKVKGDNRLLLFLSPKPPGPHWDNLGFLQKINFPVKTACSFSVSQVGGLI